MISRRDFLKGAGVAALAVAATGVLAGCSTNNTPVTPDPAPTPNPGTESKTYKLGEAMQVADGITVTVTGKRYTYYGAIPDVDDKTIFGNANIGQNIGFIGLTVKVQNDTKKDFDINSLKFILNQSDFSIKVPHADGSSHDMTAQYPLNVKAYGVDGKKDRTYKAVLEYLGQHFLGDENPAMDQLPKTTYQVGASETELCAYLGFLTNPQEADGTGTLTYTAGDKVFQVKF